MNKGQLLAFMRRLEREWAKKGVKIASDIAVEPGRGGGGGEEETTNTGPKLKSLIHSAHKKYHNMFRFSWMPNVDC